MPDIDPFNRPKQPVAKPADPERHKELLARATGQGPRVPAPPPGFLPPGVTGTPPLPMGRPVSQAVRAAGPVPTPEEREALEAIGWTPEMALPSTKEGAEQLQQVIAQHRAAEVPLPVDPRTPPLKVKTVDIDSLPAGKRADFEKALGEIILDENDKRRSAQQAASNNLRNAAVQGIGAAVGAADQAVAAFRAKTNSDPDVPIAHTPAAPSGARQRAEAARAALEAAEAEAAEEERRAAVAAAEAEAKRRLPGNVDPAPARSETGADAGLSHCPHCAWDLAVPDVPEPPERDKMAFVHCLLGGKPFVKEYDLFGGTVSVVFRTLTTREVDVIYKQAYADRESGKLPTEVDFWEHINRYRLLLQLVKFRTHGAEGYVKDMPDGYSAAANPSATGVWVKPENEATMTRDETGIPAIEQWVVDNVLKAEAVFRVVNMTCNGFNRLVAKLEAMADNSDFWRQAGPPS